jgi:hypothetical protein
MSDKQSPCWTGGLLMDTSAISIPGFNGNVERANPSSSPATLKQRFARLLCEVFEGHQEYLGVTPD